MGKEIECLKEKLSEKRNRERDRKRLISRKNKNVEKKDCVCEVDR